MRTEGNTHVPVGEDSDWRDTVWMINANVKLGKYVWKFQ